ncbi:WXG100 family type VII secretion target [Nocardia sp. NPDC057030]|uniref:WXG100 family type VII secretion target n=1 Tax=unclassified Nocardia TaxID=2637762 RepID=UPI003644B396
MSSPVAPRRVSADMFSTARSVSVGCAHLSDAGDNAVRKIEKRNESAHQINPDGLRQAAAGFDEVAEQLGKIHETLVQSTEAQGEAWGNDKFGKKFADGPKGYKVGRDNYFKSLTQLAEVAGQNAKNMRDGAKVFEENEKSQSQ